VYSISGVDGSIQVLLMFFISWDVYDAKGSVVQRGTRRRLARTTHWLWVNGTWLVYRLDKGAISIPEEKILLE
jgi:hypothetical protein